MDNKMMMIKESDDQQMELPPGFRFHPTDEELITHYLSPKVTDVHFDPVAIGEVDLKMVEPWDLPRKAKMGKKEWYFFCVRDRKYPTGLRTNRATESGYWKATGKDKEIFRAKTLVGMKKTLVFYTGRAPKGQKTNWVMHEYRLEGKYSKHILPKSAKNDWVISRVFNKGSNGKKIHIPELVRMGSYGGRDELQQTSLPPLMDSSANSDVGAACEKKGPGRNPSSHVTCFSSLNMEEEDNLKILQPDGFTDIANSGNYYTSSSSSSLFADSSPNFQFHVGDLAYPDSMFFGDQSISRLLIEGNRYPGFGSRSSWTEKSQDTTIAVSGGGCGGGGDINTDMSSGVSYREMVQRPFESYQQYNFHLNHQDDGPVDLDSLLNY